MTFSPVGAKIKRNVAVQPVYVFDAKTGCIVMRKYQTLWFCMNLPLDLEQRCAVPSGRTKFEAYISRRGGRNMAFFDELGKVISDKSKEAANRVKDITGVLQLK